MKTISFSNLERKSNLNASLKQNSIRNEKPLKVQSYANYIITNI